MCVYQIRQRFQFLPDQRKMNRQRKTPMGKVKLLTLLFALGIVVVSQVSGQKKQAKLEVIAAPMPDADKIRAHVKFLSSDLLEGRGTGQRGGDIAAEYIGTQFALDGLKPAGDDGTFFQNVPMVSFHYLPASTFKQV